MSLKIAIQKSGRLYDESISLLKKCGLKIDNAKGQLKAPLKGYDAEAYFLRNSDIPQYLADGVVDLAIIGENVLVEKEVDVNSLLKLGFSYCRLSIASPKGDMYNSVADLDGLKIATSYPSADGWSSMHSVIAQSDFWKVIAELRQAGAEGILVIPIDNMIK